MQAQAERIGLFGGTFDPVHLGHLRAARAAFDALELDRLLWVPNRQSPLRLGEDRTPGEHRLAMLQLAVREHPEFEVRDLELRREGPSYLIDTLKQLDAERPGAAWSFLMGADSLNTFDRWVQVEEIVDLASVWVMPRPGGEAERLLAALETRAPRLAGRIHLLGGPYVDLSASGIRERVRRGQSISGKVPDAVADYIRRHALYAGTS